MASVELLIIVCVATIAVDTNGDDCCMGSDRSILQPQVFIVAANSSAAAERAGAALATPEAWQSAWAAARRGWVERWQQAFQPGNSHFSGHLPTLTVDDPSDSSAAAVVRFRPRRRLGFLVAFLGCLFFRLCSVSQSLLTPKGFLRQSAIYYAGCVTLLACERTNYPAVLPRKGCSVPKPVR